MPVYISHDAHDQGDAPAEEKKEWQRIYHEANTRLKRSGTVHVYILAPADGEVIESIDIGTATREKNELLVFSQPKPDFYRIYRYEQGNDVVRGRGVRTGFRNSASRRPARSSRRCSTEPSN